MLWRHRAVRKMQLRLVHSNPAVRVAQHFFPPHDLFVPELQPGSVVNAASAVMCNATWRGGARSTKRVIGLAENHICKDGLFTRGGGVGGLG